MLGVASDGFVALRAPHPSEQTQRAMCLRGGGDQASSVTGERYSTITGDDWSQSAEDWNEFPPELWKHIKPHWEYHDPPPSTT
jgi:hypothetical protein